MDDKNLLSIDFKLTTLLEENFEFDGNYFIFEKRKDCKIFAFICRYPDSHYNKFFIHCNYAENKYVASIFSCDLVYQNSLGGKEELMNNINTIESIIKNKRMFLDSLIVYFSILSITKPPLVSVNIIKKDVNRKDIEPQYIAIIASHIRGERNTFKLTATINFCNTQDTIKINRLINEREDFHKGESTFFFGYDNFITLSGECLTNLLLHESIW